MNRTRLIVMLVVFAMGVVGLVVVGLMLERESEWEPEGVVGELYRDIREGMTKDAVRSFVPWPPWQALDDGSGLDFTEWVRSRHPFRQCPKVDLFVGDYYIVAVGYGPDGRVREKRFILLGKQESFFDRMRRRLGL